MLFAATVLTMFPEAFPGPLGVSLIGSAWRERGLWALDTVDIRAFSKDKRGFLDDTPAGGGPGQVMRADVVASALDSVETVGRPLLYMSARGNPLNQKMVREWSRGSRSGRVVRPVRGRGPAGDRRPEVRRGLRRRRGSRRRRGGRRWWRSRLACASCPGFSVRRPVSPKRGFEDGLLEHPQFTRPRTFEGSDIPEVLLSGDHRKVADWKREQRVLTTRVAAAGFVVGAFRQSTAKGRSSPVN